MHDFIGLICNALGAMLGYCLVMLFLSLKRKRWKCAGAYAALLVLSIAALAGVFLAYHFQPYGNLADAPIYAANTKGRASKKRYLGLHEIVPWHQFPIPEAEAFALTGEDASLYEAAVSQFNRKKTPEYFDSSDGFNTDMILPSVSVFGKYTTDEGNTTYVVNFVKCFFYDLGYGLDDLDNPVYTYESINNLASITLDHDGNLVSFDELGDGEDDSAVYRFCGPLTDIAEKFLAPGGWPEESARIPDTGSYEEMLQQYLNYYFER